MYRRNGTIFTWRRTDNCSDIHWTIWGPRRNNSSSLVFVGNFLHSLSLYKNKDRRKLLLSLNARIPAGKKSGREFGVSQFRIGRPTKCQDYLQEIRSRLTCRHGKTTTCGRSGRAWFSEPRTGDGFRSTAGCTSPNEIRPYSSPGRWPAYSAGTSGSTSH